MYEPREVFEKEYFYTRYRDEHLTRYWQDYAGWLEEQNKLMLEGLIEYNKKHCCPNYKDCYKYFAPCYESKGRGNNCMSIKTIRLIEQVTQKKIEELW